MPFKDRLKQLLYMRKYSKEQRVLVSRCKEKEKLRRELLEKAVFFARQSDFLQGRRKYPIKVILDSKDGILLEQTFVLHSEDALKSATLAICKAEDELIANTKGIKKIGIMADLQISLLNDKHGIVWEKLKPLR